MDVPIPQLGRLAENVHHVEVRFAFLGPTSRPFSDPCFAIVTRDPFITMFDLGRAIEQELATEVSLFDEHGLDALIAELRQPVLIARQDADPVVAFLGIQARFI